MPQPYNYIIPNKSPFEIIRENQIENIKLDAVKAAALKQQSDAREAEIQQNRRESMQKRYYEVASNPNRTYQDIENLMVEFPEFAKTMESMVKNLREDERRSKAAQIGKLYGIFETKGKEAAIEELNNISSAYRDSGDEKNAVQLEELGKAFNVAEGNVSTTSLDMMMYSLLGGDEFKKFSDALSTLKQSRREEAESPYKLAKSSAEYENLMSQIMARNRLTDEQVEKLLLENAQIGKKGNLTDQEILKKQSEIQKLDAETQKTIFETEALKRGGGISREKQIDLEMKLKDNLVKRSEDYRKRAQYYNKIVEAAKDNTGQGDYALIKSFELLLEPNSVVRESDFAQAAATSGQLKYLLNYFNQFSEGTKFKDNATRQAFLNLAAKFMQGSIDDMHATRSDIMQQVKSYNLNPENVDVADINVDLGVKLPKTKKENQSVWSPIKKIYNEVIGEGQGGGVSGGVEPYEKPLVEQTDQEIVDGLGKGFQ